MNLYIVTFLSGIRKGKMQLMTYLCPKCRSMMVGVSTASIPPITRYVCMNCSYASKPEKEILNFKTLPPWLWEEEENDERV